MVNLGQSLHTKALTLQNFGEQTLIPRKLHDQEIEYSKHAEADPSYDKSYFYTTNRDSYGYPIRVHGAVERMKQDNAGLIPHPDYNQPHYFKGTSGAIGERYRYETDPKYDTEAQKTWCYDKPPFVQATQAFKSGTLKRFVATENKTSRYY